MKFYIVTPAYNAIEWLRRCVRSVADQVGEEVEVHHHVQDGGSADGTAEWLEDWRETHRGISGYTFTYESGRDAGMYDALNQAWEKLPEDADVTAHLNADEQYLPKALHQVVQEFKRKPDTDIVLGTFIILNPDGSYHCHRRPVRPQAWRSKLFCEMITCSCFHKASTFRKHGVRCDATYKSIGDLIFFSDIMKTSPRVCVKPELLTSAYAMTGSNLAWTPATERDFERYYAKLSKMEVRVAGIVRRAVNFTRRIVDCFCAPPKEVVIYHGNDTMRTVQVVDNPTCRWKIKR